VLFFSAISRVFSWLTLIYSRILIYFSAVILTDQLSSDHLRQFFGLSEKHMKSPKLQSDPLQMMKGFTVEN